MLHFKGHHQDKSDVALTFQPSPKVADDAKRKAQTADWSGAALRFHEQPSLS